MRRTGVVSSLRSFVRQLLLQFESILLTPPEPYNEDGDKEANPKLPDEGEGEVGWSEGRRKKEGGGGCELTKKEGELEAAWKRPLLLISE